MSTQTQARATVRAEARECSCGHVGINDSHATDAACNHCEWSGPSPKEDHCPECERDGTMCLACPECGGLYKLIAECDISVDRAALTQAADAGAAEPVSIADVRRKFEEWYEVHQMPAEAGWFVRDKDDPEDYAFSPTQDAWEGFAGAMGLGVDWWGRKVAAQQLQQAVAREREKWTAIADRLLAHCGEGECETCSEIICPHGDTLHFHHDGCPTCEQEAAAIRQQGTP